MIVQCKKCGNEFNTKKRIDGIRRNCRGRSHCFDCVPFNSVIIERKEENHICYLCNKPFYSPRINNSGTNNTKKCHSCLAGIKKLKVKLKGIELLGGKCQDCGWCEYPEGFDFHHRDELEKDYEISDIENKSWQIIQDELKKCDLLCSLCHRKRHLSPKRDLYLNYIKGKDNL